MIKWLFRLFGKSDTPHKTKNSASSSPANPLEFSYTNFIKPTRIYPPKLYESDGSLVDQVSYHVAQVNRSHEVRESSDIQYSLADEPSYPSRLEILYGQLFEVPDDGKAPTFSNEVKRIMTERNISASELCERILMDRRLFSKLNTDVNYRPSKETAVALCFGLRLSYEEARVLLDRAGFSLSSYIQYDVIVTFLLQKKVYDIDEINSVLDRFNLKCIGAQK